MNYLWAFMILIGIVYGACTGNLQGVTDAAISSAQDAVELALTMCGVMSLWVGLMEIARKAGLVEKMSRGIAPFLNFLFPNLPKNHSAREYIATNMIANLLGLGWAATPAGLKAMEELGKLEEERREADQSNRRSADAGYNNRRDASQSQAEQSKRKMETQQNESVEKQALWGALHRGRNMHKQKPVMPPGVASNEMCTFLIINIASLQLIPVNVIAYRSQYGSVNPTGIVGPAIAATAINMVIMILFCKFMDRPK